VEQSEDASWYAAEAASSARDLPAAQLAQDVAALDPWYLPDGQTTHEEAESELVRNVPAKHAVHALEPVAEA
jgi:hypothetical protein